MSPIFSPKLLNDLTSQYDRSVCDSNKEVCAHKFENLMQESPTYSFRDSVQNMMARYSMDQTVPKRQRQPPLESFKDSFKYSYTGETFMDKVIEKEEPKEEKPPPEKQDPPRSQRGEIVIIKPQEQEFSEFSIRDIQIRCTHQRSPEQDQPAERPKTVGARRGQQRSFL